MPRRRNKKISGGFWPFDSNCSSSGYGNSGYGNSGYGNSGSGFFGNLFGTSRRNYGTNSGSGFFGNLFGNTGYGNTGYGNAGYGNAGYGNAGYGNAGYNGYDSQPRYGGKTKRHMKGGYHANSPTTGLAINAAPFSGQTAQPHNWVGGRTRRHKSHKSCKHICGKSCNKSCIHRCNKSCRNRK